MPTLWSNLTSAAGELNRVFCVFVHVLDVFLDRRSVRKLVAPRAHAVAWSKDVIAVGASHPPWNASGIITLIHAATGEPFASFGSVGFRWVKPSSYYVSLL